MSEISTFFAKQPSTGLSKEERKAVWIFHVGFNIRETICPLCGIAKINLQEIASGFVGAHIVAKDHCPSAFKTSPYMIIPSCVSCNSIMGQECAITRLWHAKRLQVIKDLSWRVYSGILLENPDFCAKHDHQLWKVVQTLWGSKGVGELGFSIDPNIETDLYLMLKAHQMERLNDEIIETSGILKKRIKLLDELAETTIPEYKKKWV